MSKILFVQILHFEDRKKWDIDNFYKKLSVLILSFPSICLSML